MEVQEVKEQLKAIFRQVINNDKWITIHPHGEDSDDYRRIKLEDGETPKEAIDRVYKKEDKQSDSKDGKEKNKKEYPNRHAEILYKDLPELREKLHKAKYERAKNKEKGADVSLYDKKIKEYEEEEQQLKDEMAELRDSRRSQAERYTSLIEEQKQSDSRGDKVSDTKILEGGIKESQDKYGRTKFSKGNKWADVTSNGGKSDSWIASYGQSYLSPVKWEREKGVREEQLFSSRSFKTEKGARKWALDQLKRITNNKEQNMALLEELKKLITKVENTKGEEDMEIENEKVDKRDIIRQIMAIAGKEEASEDVKTIAKLAEKLAYDKSEAGTADNEKEDKKEDAENCKAKNEDDEEEVKEIKEEVKEDVENKCKNSVENAKVDYFAKLNEIYNATSQVKKEASYVSRADREKAAEDYFAK